MKIARHAKILELIETYEIETQDELAQKLCDEGFNVTPLGVSFLLQRILCSLKSEKEKCDAEPK